MKIICRKFLAEGAGAILALNGFRSGTKTEKSDPLVVKWCGALELT